MERVRLFGPIPIVRRSRKNVTAARARPFVGAAKTLVFIETRVVGDVPGCRSPLGRIDAILTCAGHSRRATRAGDGAVDFELGGGNSRKPYSNVAIIGDGHRVRGKVRTVYSKVNVVVRIQVHVRIGITQPDSSDRSAMGGNSGSVRFVSDSHESTHVEFCQGTVRPYPHVSRSHLHRPGNRVHVVDHVVPSRRRKRRTAACLRKRAPSRGRERRADSKNRERQEESDADSRPFRHIGNDVLFHIKNKLRI